MLSVGMRALSYLHYLGDLLRMHEHKIIFAALIQVNQVSLWCLIIIILIFIT